MWSGIRAWHQQEVVVSQVNHMWNCDYYEMHYRAGEIINQVFGK